MTETMKMTFKGFERTLFFCTPQLGKYPFYSNRSLFYASRKCIFSKCLKGPVLIFLADFNRSRTRNTVVVCCTLSRTARKSSYQECKISKSLAIYN